MVVIDDGPDWGIWTVVDDECGFNLHLLDKTMVLFGVVKDELVVFGKSAREVTPTLILTHRESLRS